MARQYFAREITKLFIWRWIDGRHCLTDIEQFYAQSESQRSFDPGSTTIVIKASTMPDKTVPVDMRQGKRNNTIAGTIDTSQMVKLRNVKLQKNDKNCRIESVKALIFENEYTIR